MLGDDGAAVARGLPQGRSHHFTFIGNRVVEGQGLQGRGLHTVAKEHPRQGRSKPVLFPGFGDMGVALPLDLNARAIRQAQLVHAVNEGLGFFRILRVKGLDDARVGGQFKRTTQGNSAITALVRVVHIASVDGVDAGRRVDDVRRVDNAVFKANQQGCHFKGGSRFRFFPNSVVAQFAVDAVLRGAA